ncbi:MAG: EAL domain-containing protein [Clostridia bacterium]|nr:EAL domain-containing protein [Clostridia bacterium]
MKSVIRYSGQIRRKILILETSGASQGILNEALCEKYDLCFVNTGAEALIELHKEKYSLVIVDLNENQEDRVAFLDLFFKSDDLKSIPTTVITSDTELELYAIRLGVADFISKSFEASELILAKCDRVIELAFDRMLVKSTENDPLTGLYTPDFFFQYVRQILNYTSREERDALVLDVEHFHLINEIYGRDFGDRLLKEMADALRKLKPETDGIVCRSGVDCFLVYCKHLEGYDAITSAMEEVLNLPELQRFRVRIGVYHHVDHSIEPERWFDRAKKACDQLRGDYTRSISVYDENLMEKSVFEERLVYDIKRAIENEELLVYYQPKYDIQVDVPRLASAEALIRWNHPEYGLIGPDKFIPLFEKNGMIQLVDDYMWRRTARQIAAWRDKYGFVLPISVNVSHIDIFDEHLEEKLESITEANNLTPDAISLEITESAYSSSADRLIMFAENMRKRGYKIAMDDFGVGSSSLNMLTQLPFDVLKLDMQFVRNMEKDRKSRKMVDLVIDIAKFLEVTCVAEGVETKAQYQLLRDMRCDYAQGYYFSKPVNAEKFEKLIEAELK